MPTKGKGKKGKGREVSVEERSGELKGLLGGLEDEEVVCCASLVSLSSSFMSVVEEVEGKRFWDERMENRFLFFFFFFFFFFYLFFFHLSFLFFSFLFFSFLFFSFLFFSFLFFPSLFFFPFLFFPFLFFFPFLHSHFFFPPTESSKNMQRAFWGRGWDIITKE